MCIRDRLQPIYIILITLVLLKFVRILAVYDFALLDYLAIIALLSGTLFNVVRISSGIYILYFVVFVILVFISDFFNLIMRRSIIT